MRGYKHEHEKATSADRTPRQVSEPSGARGSSAQELLALQRAVGNAAVARFLAVQRTPAESSRKRAATTTGTPSGKRVRRPPDLTQEEKGIADRERPLRMLDRVGRILYDSMTAGVPTIQGREPTPHFAVILRDGAFHVSGNTGNRFTAQHREAALERLTSAAQGRDSAQRISRPEALSDLAKIRDVVNGKYDIGDPDAQWFEEFKQALGRPVEWDTSMVEQGQPENVHGEMNLLGTIIDDQFRKEPDNKRTEQVVRLGGRLQPCQMCAWVIRAVNEDIGAYLGFKVVATQTSGVYDDNWEWHVPQWLMPRLTQAPTGEEYVSKDGRMYYTWQRFQELAAYGGVTVRNGKRKPELREARRRDYARQVKKRKKDEHREKNRSRFYLEPVESESEADA
jgi:hypothetical protein